MPMSFCTILGPVRVPDTDTVVPSARVPCSVVTLRKSSDTSSVTRRDSQPRSLASSGALT